MTEINPTSVATQMATAAVQPLQTLLSTQSKTAQDTSSALTKLQSALRAFDSALLGLSGKKSLVQYSATFGATGFGTATASAGAQPGTYSLFVEQVATAHQVSYANLPTVPVPVQPASLLAIQVSGTSFNVDFGTADTDADGNLSQAEIARAINQASGNQGKVNAVIVTVSGQTQLMLSAGSTGASSAISLDTTNLSGGLKTYFDTTPATTLAAPQDAIVWMGAQNTGVKLQQASNTFTAIPGVTMTFTQAQAAGAAPLTLTVAGDDSATAANVRGFVDAYNTLKKALDDLTNVGDAEKGAAAAAFATDAGVRTLRSRLNSLIRQNVGGLRIMDFGISADRDGNLSLDSAKLQKGLAAHPGGLDTVFGSASPTAKSGVLGSLDTYLDVWLNSGTGQIKRRQDSVQNRQKVINTRQTQLDQQYTNYYNRYLQQFSRLQSLQAQMSDTANMFANLGGN
ncbi:MAG: fliD [Rhodocyclaceae bacterium]|nr:fliD [Rhodocyclaceae bacterium]